MPLFFAAIFAPRHPAGRRDVSAWGEFGTAEPWLPLPPAGSEETVPVDRRCPGCGLERDGCESRLCSRRHDDEED